MNDTAITPTMIFSFQGTGVSFYGQPTDNLKLNYTFDGSRSRVAETNFTRGIPGKTGVRLWGVENIAATIHSVTLIPTAGQPILDYIVVTPFDYASLSEKILALDDTDSVIKYSGSWTSKSGDTLSGGLAYNDTRHGSTQAGDNFTISFNGANHYML
ncbi:hypothetical protein DXG03_002451 [Asterophora parasitica]|uniref:Uncharacterized protein n=1 Tax=Asterophora parasitica TaxID=117018 RepID=A0A9P7GG73_9AGAR|nr:hypothetical protein DXG03_002451 [Asterophora parasitica]